MNITPGANVRLVRCFGDPIPPAEQLSGVVARISEDGFEAEVNFLHDGEPAFDFWPIDELELLPDLDL